MNLSSRPLPRLGIVVMSAISDDPRVRRQGDLFTAAGWSVKGFGLSGARSSAPGWPIYDSSPEPADPLTGDNQAPLGNVAQSTLQRKLNTAFALVNRGGLKSTLFFALGRITPWPIKRIIRLMQQGAYAVGTRIGV